MKRFLRNVLKFCLVVLILASFGINIGLTIAFLVKNKEVNELNNLYLLAQSNLNQSASEKDLTIENLQSSFRELNDEIQGLRNENNTLKEQLDSTVQEGFGQIKGEILPFIVGDSSFSQYQLVCAQNVSNRNLQYCITVSALEKDYTLVVPAGKYEVTARIASNDSNIVIAKYKGTYTEYIKCAKEKASSQCNKSQLTKPVQIEIKSNQTLEHIDPIDWLTV